MKQRHQLRVEIVGRDQFWQKAVMVEWEHQFPERKLIAEAENRFLIEAAWLRDLERVAKECFSKVLVAPKDPGRRLWLRRFLPPSEREHNS